MTDIAEKAGVSSATVSLALSNHPRISATTKAHVWEICKQMGYQPDPVAKALAYKASEIKKSSYLGTLALLEGELRFKHTQTPWGQQWNQQMTGTCLNMGYRLDHFVVGSTEKEQRALSRVLQTRGIKGILVYGANAEIHQWMLEWEQFAVVAYAASLHEHFVHNVMSSSYQDVYDSMIQLYGRGYQRAGFFIVGVDGSLDYWLAGYITALQSLGQKQILPHLNTAEHTDQKKGREKFIAWFRRYKPDVIITNTDVRLLEALAAEGVRVPEDVGIFCVDVLSCMLHLSGLFQLREVCYQVMVDLLHGMLMRHEFGPPARPYCVQIPPLWNEGGTLRPAK